MLRVVFACVHNAGRLQMAAAFFNAIADPARARAISAGSHPADRMNPVVVDAMREVGIEMAAATPQQLTAELAGGARWLITMGCGDECPVAPGLVREDWPLDDPAGQPLVRVRMIRDDIRARVETFLDRERLR